MRFLIADDNRNDGVLIREALLAEFRDAQFVRLDSGKELAREMEKGCDALLVEAHTAWADGLTLLRQARKRDPYLPALMLTEQANVQLAVTALKAGFNDFLLKAELSRLPAALRACLERAKTQREDDKQEVLKRERQERLRAEAAIQRLSAIQKVTDAALSTLELDQLLHELLQRICQVLGGETATVLLLAEDQKHLLVRASFGLDGNVDAIEDKTLIPFGQGLVGKIAAQNEPLIVNDLKEVAAASGLTGVLGQKTRSLVGAPLRARDRVIGVVHVGTQTRRRFTREDLGLLQVVADRAASAIERAQLYEEVLAARDRLHTLSRQLIEAQEQERRRLARELHDETGQALTAVKLNLQALRQRSSDLHLSAKLQDSIGIVEQSLEQLRDLSHELRPAVLDDFGLVAALRWFVDRQSQRAGLRGHFSAPEKFVRVATEVETACFRLVQEALTNVSKHARARNVWVELRETAAGFELSVRDDGRGFAVDSARLKAMRGGSMGLLSMQERTQLAGGRFELKSGQSGTELRAQFAR
ncbi:MAG: GAF domain-containing protein [Acidobacteria bacterium]|nr:GAF domain-containing protein [Acidobacteriota bacterium]